MPRNICRLHRAIALFPLTMKETLRRNSIQGLPVLSLIQFPGTCTSPPWPRNANTGIRAYPSRILYYGHRNRRHLLSQQSPRTPHRTTPQSRPHRESAPLPALNLDQIIVRSGIVHHVLAHDLLDHDVVVRQSQLLFPSHPASKPVLS